MQSKQGAGLPAMPVTARGEPVKASFMTDAPPPDQTVAAQLSQEYNDGVKAEDQVLTGPQDARTQPAMGGEAAPPAPAPAPAAPTQLELGETVDRVVAAMGQPVRIVDLNTKIIYVYRDLKITFKGGKVSDIQ